MRTSSLIPLLLALLPLSNAATCTSPNQVLLVSGPDPIQMMWSIRAVACNGDNWWKSLKITSNDGPYGAEAFTRNMVSQQNCWDSTEQIITQCMGDQPGNQWPNYFNGGWYEYKWTNEDEYTEAWFWNINSSKRDVIEARDKTFVSQKGEVFEADEVLELDMTTGAVTTVAK